MGRVRFANASDGWAFGPSLYATHDGGAHWHQVQLASSHPRIADLATDGTAVLAFADNCSLSGGSCQGAGHVYRSAVGSDAWQKTGGAASPYFAAGAHLTFGDGIAYLSARQRQPAGSISLSTDEGRTWRTHRTPCDTTQQFPLSLDGVAAVGHSRLNALCAGDGAAGTTTKALYSSTDGGAHFSRTGTPPRGGDGGTLAAASASTLVIATASAGSWLYRSTDSGKHWNTVRTFIDGGWPWNDLGFTTATQGVVIHGAAESSRSPGTLLMTHDAGAHWSTVHFGR